MIKCFCQLSMWTKMINNDIHNRIKFIVIGSAGVKYFNTETISTTKCENTVIFNLEIWATSMKNT